MNLRQSLTGRLLWIDGLKGLFSILVVFCHLACVFVPGLYNIKDAKTAFEVFWVNSPLNVITNGNTAVQFFFFASGLLITRNVYIKSKKRERFKPLEKKYLSFLSVVAPAITFSFLLMSFGLMFHQQALALDLKLTFVDKFNNFQPSFVKYLFEVLLGTFVKGSDYVNPLWTIRYELLGTIITYSLAYYVCNNRQRGFYTYAFACVALILTNVNLCTFMFGAAVWDLVVNKDTTDDLLSKLVLYIERNNLIKLVFMLVGIYLACCNMQVTGVYSVFGIISPFASVIRAIGVAICAFIICLCPNFQRIFSMKCLTELGNVSAYVYAFHWPIILSLGCGLFVVFYNKLNYNICVLIISISCVSISVIIAYLYKRISKIITHTLFKKFKSRE